MFIDFLIMGLACWRLSNMIVGEEGPWHVFARIRQWVGVDSNLAGVYPEDRWYVQVFECVWCASVWVGIALAALYSVYPWLAVMLSVPFGISAMAIVIHETMQNMQP